jgi:hypothetical protein
LEVYGDIYEDLSQFITPYIIIENTIPDDWRSLLFTILSKPIPNIAGSFADIFHSRKTYFEWTELDLTYLDTSFLLAIKIAVQANQTIQTTDQEIIISLSGGMSATLSFRKKGDLIAAFQRGPFEIFAKLTKQNRSYELEQYKFQTLYYQKGYADSEIQIETPVGYYLLTENYVIEITFNPAPILFDSSFVRNTPNISGKAKRADEIEAEEAERRRREEDDY